MRARLVFALIWITVAGAATSACPETPPTETPTPCPYGEARAEDAGVCGPAWADVCASASDDGCVSGSAVRCDIDDVHAVPAYDCVSCGCGGGDACVDIDAEQEGAHLCLSAAVREGERNADVIDDGLSADDYLAVFDRALRGDGARTRAAWLDDVRAARALDPRRAVIVVGSDETNTEAALAPLFGGAFGNPVRVDDDDRCGAVSVDVRAADDDGVVAVSARDRAADVTCLLPGVFARCAPPAVAGCATARGLVPSALILLGAQAQADVERALLSSAARAPRAQWLVRIDDQISRFDDVFLRAPGAAFAVPEVDGAVVVIADVVDAEVAYAVHVDHAAPRILRAFRALLADAVIDQFFSTHDIVPAACSFGVVRGVDVGSDVDVVHVVCDKNGAHVEGDVVGNDTGGVALTAP